MLSTPPEGCARRFLVLGIVLGSPAFGCCSRTCLAQSPPAFRSIATALKPPQRTGTGAIVAAESAAIRGDLWANAAFTGARFLWIDRLANLDRPKLEATRAGQGQRGDGVGPRADQRRGMALFGQASGHLAGRREPCRHASRNVLFHRAERAGTCSLPRLERAATSSALADKDIQAFVKRRYSGDLEPPAGISTSHHSRLSQRLAAESTDFRISCRRR